MSVREKDDPALYTKIQEQNLLRQYDLNRIVSCSVSDLSQGSAKSMDAQQFS
jgi:hypothetical protein